LGHQRECYALNHYAKRSIDCPERCFACYLNTTICVSAFPLCLCDIPARAFPCVCFPCACEVCAGSSPRVCPSRGDSTAFRGDRIDRDRDRDRVPGRRASGVPSAVSLPASSDGPFRPLRFEPRAPPCRARAGGPLQRKEMQAQQHSAGSTTKQCTTHARSYCLRRRCRVRRGVPSRSSMPIPVLLPVAGILSLYLHAAHTVASSSSSSTGTALVSSSSTGDWNSSSSSSGGDVLVLGPMFVAYLCEAIIWGLLTLVWLFFFSATLLALRFSPKKKVATAKLLRTHAQQRRRGWGATGARSLCCVLPALVFRCWCTVRFWPRWTDCGRFLSNLTSRWLTLGAVCLSSGGRQGSGQREQRQLGGRDRDASTACSDRVLRFGPRRGAERHLAGARKKKGDQSAETRGIVFEACPNGAIAPSSAADVAARTDPRDASSSRLCCSDGELAIDLLDDLDAVSGSAPAVRQRQKPLHSGVWFES
jgi:hypothetical protein